MTSWKRHIEMVKLLKTVLGISASFVQHFQLNRTSFFVIKLYTDMHTPYNSIILKIPKWCWMNELYIIYIYKLFVTKWNHQTVIMIHWITLRRFVLNLVINKDREHAFKFSPEQTTISSYLWKLLSTLGCSVLLLLKLGISPANNLLYYQNSFALRVN